jgi:hypothetical protein
VTLLFSDIAGFTSIAEKMEPNELLLLLSDYFTMMAEVGWRQRQRRPTYDDGRREGRTRPRRASQPRRSNAARSAAARACRVARRA